MKWIEERSRVPPAIENIATQESAPGLEKKNFWHSFRLFKVYKSENL